MCNGVFLLLLLLYLECFFCGKKGRGKAATELLSNYYFPKITYSHTTHKNGGFLNNDILLLLMMNTLIINGIS